MLYPELTLLHSLCMHVQSHTSCLTSSVTMCLSLIFICLSSLFCLRLPVSLLLQSSGALLWILLYLADLSLFTASLHSFQPSSLLCSKVVIGALQWTLPPTSLGSYNSSVTLASFPLSPHPSPPPSSLSLSDKSINCTLHAYFTPSLRLVLLCLSVFPTASLCLDEKAKVN